MTWAAKSATPNIRDQDSTADVVTLAKALVCARTGARCAEVAAILSGVPETENGGRTLALGRGLGAYVLAADLVSYRDPVFVAWVRAVRTETLSGMTLISTQESRPNNWGTHAGASRIAADLYLGDAADLARAVTVFRGWLGDRTLYAGFSYGDLSWQADPSRPVGVNPVGSVKLGHSIDGVLPDDQRRGGGFTWPPPCENYVWEALQGATLAQRLLANAGYPSAAWSDAALTRAVNWLDANGCRATGDDDWVPWMLGRGTITPTNPGKGFGFADWLFP